MKSVIPILATTLLILSPGTFVQAQSSTPSAIGKGVAPAGAGKRTDVYHVHFTKAALGKAVQLGDWLRRPMPTTRCLITLLSFAIKTATRGITLSSRTLARKRLWKLRARLCLPTNVI